jgi:tetratricopeptide (TPR) repeat protein
MKLPFLNPRAIVFVAVLSLLLSFWLGANPRAGAQGRLGKPSGHINDFAGVLDAPTKQQLERVLENLKQRTGIDFVIATVKTSGSQDLYDYSLSVANDWAIGVPVNPNKSILLVLAADNGKFFTQLSKGARAVLPDSLVGDMGHRMRQRIESVGYSQGLVTGIQVFSNGLGEWHKFSFADLDAPAGENVTTQQQRPRTVASPSAEQIAKATGTPTETPAPARTPEPSPSTAPEPSPTVAAAPPVIESPQPSASPESSPSLSPSTQPAEPPASPLPSEAAPSPVSTPEVIPQPSVATLASPTPEAPKEVRTATPVESPAAQVSPSEVAKDSPRPNRTAPDRRTSQPANPEDEKEEVELTLTLPPDKRIEALKAFIAAHPRSVAVPRANELIIVAHAMLGDQKLKAGDIEGGKQQFRLAISEAPSDIPDRLFVEVIARIPTNLFLRGQQVAATEAAHQAEALAKLNHIRLLAVAEYYLAIEDAKEAGRLAELAVQSAPDSAAAHQTLGAARHIGLRLEEAEAEYARALALDPKSGTARLALADLRRSNGKAEAALTLYREHLQADPRSYSARAGVVLSLLELGKKDEGEVELNSALQDKAKPGNLPLLVGVAYWYLAHNEPARGLEFALRAVALEPRYSWAQIALARAHVANRRPQDAETSLRFVRQFSRFATLDYELASMLAQLGLYDEAVQELSRSFTIKNGLIETKLAGRNVASAASFTELLAPERRAAIFQARPADTEENAKMLKALLALHNALNGTDGRTAGEDELSAIAQDFTAGNDAMRTFRQVYVAGKLVDKRVALSTAVDVLEQAIRGVEVALSEPVATIAVQADELGDIRARAFARGGTANVPDAPRSALSGLLRGRIEDLAGLALFNLDKPADAVAHLRRAISAAPEGTPLMRSAQWHLGAALEASGKSDQALLYYIKSYVAGPPDQARRSVIENAYKKVNGSLDGLDDKIGPGFATATAPPSPAPKP